MLRLLSPLLLMIFLSVSLPIAAEDKLRLQLKWGHQFQFAGYYAAIQQGYYAEEGLSVELIPAGPGLDPVVEVLAGRAEFGVGTSDLLIHHWKGEPISVLAVFFQHSPLLLLSTRKGDIQTLHDLAGQRVAIEPGSAELFAYLKREGLSPETLQIVEHDHQLDELINGDIAAQSVYVTTEPFELEQLGMAYQVYSPRSVGIDFYGDNLFTTHQAINDHPERVAAFRRASLRGWLYAMTHTDEIIEHILENYPTPRSREALRFEADAMQQLMRTDLLEPGHMIPGRWQHMAEIYAEIGMLPHDVSLDGFLYQSKPEPVDLSRIYLGLVIASILALLFALATSYTLRNNKRLKQSEQQFRTLFDNAPLAFIVSNSRGEICDWNIAASRIFGWSRDEAIGKGLLTLLVGSEDIETIKTVIQSTLDEEKTTHFINPNRTQSGKIITCEWVNSLYEGSKVDGDYLLLSIGMDVTERVLLEKSLHMARDEAQEALEDNKQLMAMLSHELRSPLATITTTTAVVETALRTGEYAAAVHMVERCRPSIRRISAFLENLTADDRLNSHLDSTDNLIHLPDLLQKIHDALNNIYPHRSLELEMVGTEELPLIDPVLFEVLITNLLDNALKYSPEHSVVRLTVTAQEDGAVTLTVSDQGPGIDPKLHQDVFRKYFRGKHIKNTSGTGLGLYLVKRIVDMRRGRIAIQSPVTEGIGGTIVQVYLPSVV